MAEKRKSDSRHQTAVELVAKKVTASAPRNDETAHQLAGQVNVGVEMQANFTVSRHITSPKQLGEFVAFRRKAKGLNQQDFGDLAGVGRRFVSELDGGKETAQIGKVMKVLQALGIDLIIRDR